MGKILILTKEQADKIRGNYGRYSVLEPVALPDGLFMLPEDCLSDPNLKDAFNKLSEAKALNGTKNILSLSKVTTITKGEYYLDDISPVTENSPGSGIVKALRTTNKISIKDSTLFLNATKAIFIDNKGMVTTN